MTVYFVRCSGTGYVKIGKANHPHKRLKQLQAASPFELSIEAVMRGSHALEAELHRRFAKRCVRGEWFDLSREQVRSIATVIPPRPEFPHAEFSFLRERFEQYDRFDRIARSSVENLAITYAVFDSVEKYVVGIRHAARDGQDFTGSQIGLAREVAERVIRALSSEKKIREAEESIEYATFRMSEFDRRVARLNEDHAAAVLRWESLYGPQLRCLLEVAAA